MPNPPQIKSEEDSDEIFEDEARHIRKVVLCVLLEEWRAVLGKVAEDSSDYIKSRFESIALNS